MTSKEINIGQTEIRKILGAANPDAALLYLYILSGNSPDNAQQELHITASRLTVAMATLRQLGLLPEKQLPVFQPGERPAYTEEDVLKASRDMSFRGLYEEIERQLGRNLNTEELKIILGFTRYLGLSADVILLLVRFCCEKAHRRGLSSRPSLRAIEKEAYFWAENGIDTLEEASAYIQNQNFRYSRIHGIMEILQIHGRALTKPEEKYAQGWLDSGFEDSAISLAYDRTCLNTGGLNWAYMNKILQRWAKQGLTSAEAVEKGESKAPPKGASGQLGQAEMEAIQRILREE